MKGSGIIIKKELLRVFGDRKLIFSLFVLPAVMVILIYGLMGKMIGSMETDIDTHKNTVYFVNAPASFNELLKATGYTDANYVNHLTTEEFAAEEADLRAQVKDGMLEGICVFEKDFEKILSDVDINKANNRIPRISMIYNGTENYSSMAYSTLGNLVLAEYKNRILAERFGSLDIMKAFDFAEEQEYREEKANSQFASMLLPYLIVLLLYAGAMSVGVDAIAGEKERGTLASMLLSPVSRSNIVIGKLVALVIVSSLSSVVYAVSMVFAMSLMGDENDMIGLGGVSFGAVQIVELLVTMICLVYLYVAIIAFCSVLAKDVKTANTYVMPAYFIVIICGIMTMFISGNDIPLSRYAIPVYGNALAIRDITMNQLAPANFGVSLIGVVVLGAILTVAVSKAFDSEKLMFNA